MNVADGENGTANAGVSPHLISAKVFGQNGRIEMGVEASVCMDIIENKIKPVLLLLNIEEYRKIESQLNP